MIFEPTNYLLLLEDFLYSFGVGFFIGFIQQIIGIFFQKGRKSLFAKDILVSIIFSILIFSYVISFANYPVLRVYHVAGGVFGLYLFPFNFSKPINRIMCHFSNNIYNIIKPVTCNIFLKIKEKISKSRKEKNPKKCEISQILENDLQSNEVKVYNL